MRSSSIIEQLNINIVQCSLQQVQRKNIVIYYYKAHCHIFYCIRLYGIKVENLQEKNYNLRDNRQLRGKILCRKS